jgi:quercetin dioxygenase-like cupin family protein
MTDVVAGPPTDCHRRFLDDSTRAVIALSSVVVGRGEYLPGWRWSRHAGPQTGRPADRHVGYVLSGAMRVRSADGAERTVRAGEAFEVGPGHDAWVEGHEPCVALDVTPRATVD